MPLCAADRFTGYQSCAASACHGGGTGDDQMWIWVKKDPHGRADSILSAQRSKRIGEALGIADTTKSAQCTVCHSPMQSAAPERFLSGVKPNRGVSCEVCHGPAEKWVRFHTRMDVTHAQRVAAGMRDLEKPGQRANACAGCHLNLPSALQSAGHPELRFELAQQLVELPPHWKGDVPMDAPREWLAGQAVSLRELAWRVQKTPDAAVSGRISALHWILRQTSAGAEILPMKDVDVAELRAAANRLATASATTRWTPRTVRAQIETLCKNAPMFRDGALDAGLLRRRAETLAPAIRALVIPLRAGKMDKLDEQLRALDEQLRNPVSLEPAKFAALLEGVPALLP
jgi:hypothetical protein